MRWSIVDEMNEMDCGMNDERNEMNLKFWFLL